jgi:hypothetical protein
MFNPAGARQRDVIDRCAAELEPLIDTVAYTHKRRHNIYFRTNIDGLAPDHPALHQRDTINPHLAATSSPKPSWVASTNGRRSPIFSPSSWRSRSSI